jgi:hypothetical protein
MTECDLSQSKEDMLTRNNDVTPQNPEPKPAWRSPKLEELGNLRDFVQAGNAFGKSGPNTDGSSDPGGEMMS